MKKLSNLILKFDLHAKELTNPGSKKVLLEN